MVMLMEADMRIEGFRSRVGTLSRSRVKRKPCEAVVPSLEWYSVVSAVYDYKGGLI